MDAFFGEIPAVVSEKFKALFNTIYKFQGCQQDKIFDGFSIN